ncbi:MULTISPECIES: cytochrome c oxidase subunit II [Gammaproteobacteria]|uniref:cytochrome c oxidase subunit II n=1 Tax=Gammaproteobacteria TaxID=1236 RepID=UPI000DD0805C|nr:cytochrome c oxidase subunit II [Aliidiomarina sp. B3213]TCZ90970.1 cytochrome c oxidase subunit II [Lysobacter sp. N42]
MKTRRTSLLAGLLALVATPVAWANDLQLNMTQGSTDMSQHVYGLHMLVFYICVVIGVLVFGTMFVSIFRHRKSRGVTPAKFHDNVKVEIAWTVIPFLILVAMAVPATITLFEMDDTDDSDLTVVVTGSQWRWHYSYLDHDVEFQSILATQNEQIYGRLPKTENYLSEVDRPLVIPTDTKVRFLITSEDVIHSWWVPEFAIKKDANPGYINEVWTRVNEPGIYRGVCAELCGQGHAFMPIVVIAKEPAEFQEWINAEEERLAAERAEEERLLSMNMSMDQLMETGRNIYLAQCAACHQPNGQGIPGVFPRLAGEGVSVGDRTQHIDIVVNGVSGTAMQSFQNSLSMSEIAAVITYERNAWGNDTGDAVQPADIHNFIQGNQ